MTASPQHVQPVLPAPVHYVSFIGPINENTAQTLIAVTNQQIQQGAATVYFLLSTPGGQVKDGIALYNVLRGLPCTIVTHNSANVDSIGNVVFLAGEYRYACPNATFMFHGVGFDMQQGTRVELKNAKELTDGITAETNKIATVIDDRATFPARSDIDALFVEASTKDAAYAQGHGIVHEIRDVQVPAGSPFLPLVF